MINILFVCLGNICRSPSAEGVMLHLVKKNNLSDKIRVDSAGVIGYHEGDPADSRMRKHASKRGIELLSRSRPIKGNDLKEFDYIITMDDQNYSDVTRMDIDGKYSDKIIKMTSFLKKFNHNEIPDPYYGGAEGFELVLDLLDDACSNFLEWLKLKHQELGNE